MRTYKGEKYDVIVIGGGHAGVEASLACARMGKKTLMLTLNLDGISLMACNPSIGGTAKGHLVREIDALGGEMGIAADANFLQIKMLNSSKGPAVHSLRAQIDKRRYHEFMKSVCENTENLYIKQDEAEEILTQNGIQHRNCKFINTKRPSHRIFLNFIDVFLLTNNNASLRAT